MIRQGQADGRTSTGRKYSATEWSMHRHDQERRKRRPPKEENGRRRSELYLARISSSAGSRAQWEGTKLKTRVQFDFAGWSGVPMPPNPANNNWVGGLVESGEELSVKETLQDLFRAGKEYPSRLHCNRMLSISTGPKANKLSALRNNSIVFRRPMIFTAGQKFYGV